MTSALPLVAYHLPAPCYAASGRFDTIVITGTVRRRRAILPRKVFDRAVEVFKLDGRISTISRVAQSPHLEV